MRQNKVGEEGEGGGEERVKKRRGEKKGEKGR